MNDEPHGLDRGLTNYGDRDFARFLRRSFARSMGISNELLHVAPEAAIGGPLEAVRNSDRIRLSVAEKRIDLLVDEAEIERRLADFSAPPSPARGYKALYRRTVLQAPKGCDFDFLTKEAGNE